MKTIIQSKIIACGISFIICLLYLVQQASGQSKIQSEEDFYKQFYKGVTIPPIDSCAISFLKLIFVTNSSGKVIKTDVVGKSIVQKKLFGNL